MNFEYSDRVKDLERRLVVFMDEHVYPNEAAFHQEIAAGDRWQPTRIMETLKERARAAGLWNLFLPRSHESGGLSLCRSRLSTYKCPSEVRLVRSQDQLPRGTSGKVQRQLVERWARESVS